MIDEDAEGQGVADLEGRKQAAGGIEIDRKIVESDCFQVGRDRFGAAFVDGAIEINVSVITGDGQCVAAVTVESQRMAECDIVLSCDRRAARNGNGAKLANIRGYAKFEDC